MKKYKQQLYIIGLVIVLAIVLVFVVFPISKDIVSLRDSIFAQREELEKMYLRGQLLKKMQIQLQKIDQDIEKIDSAVLTEEKQLELITVLEKIASDNNLSQEIVMDSLPENISKVTALPIEVRLNGKFTDILGYVLDVERQDFYLTWKSVSVGSGVGTQRIVRRGPNVIPETKKLTNIETVDVVLVGESYWKP